MQSSDATGLRHPPQEPQRGMGPSCGSLCPLLNPAESVAPTAAAYATLGVLQWLQVPNFDGLLLLFFHFRRSFLVCFHSTRFSCYQYPCQRCPKSVALIGTAAHLLLVIKRETLIISFPVVTTNGWRLE